MPSPGLTVSYHVIRALLKIAMLIFARATVRGIERVPRSGAGIVVCNHIDAVDPAVLVAVLPRPIVLMSKVENSHGPLRFFLPLVGAFTVRRGKVDRQALRTAERVLDQGRLLCIFPEGTRNREAGLGPAHGGVALLAFKTGAPIIPVALTGTAEVFRRHFPWVGFPHLTITIGEPFFLQPPAAGSHRADRERMTVETMARIAALLPPELRGSYQAVTDG